MMKRWVGTCFLLDFFFVSIGSAYYHYRPNNWTLVWDRLPMTLGFMSLYYLSQKNFLPESKISLSGNILLGGVSVVIWYLTLFLNKGEVNKIPVNYLGNNDGTKLTRAEAQKQIRIVSPKLQDQLVPYYIIQFYPIVALLYMLYTWPQNADLRRIYVIPAIILYILAKVLESLDLVSDKFYTKIMGGAVSGHSLKHLAAGLAAISFMVYIAFAK